MSKSHLQSIYDMIGEETIEEIVHAFYPKVYADPDLIPIFDVVEMKEIMRKQYHFRQKGSAFFHDAFVWVQAGSKVAGQTSMIMPSQI